MQAVQAPQLALVAGEASGDLLGGLLLAELRRRWPDLRSVGIGGADMQAQGLQAWWPIEQLSVRGYVEVLPRLPGLLRMRGELGRRLLADAPDAFIGIDAPDFNFGLEARLKAAGIPTVHFVSPSFWAWRPEKLVKLRAAADHVLCLFPFEPDLLRAAGVPTTYVGHPLAQVIPQQADRAGARQALGVPEGAELLALLPGSRAAELRHLGPRFFQAALQLQAERPQLHLAVPAVPWLRDALDALARRTGAAAAFGPRLHMVTGQSHQVLAACDVTLIASGTATLEAALFKRPMVIAYAMPALSYRLMRRRRQLPWIGLPNVLCADPSWLRPAPGVSAHAHADAADAPFVVPELVQDAATPAALAAAVRDWLDAPQRRQVVQKRVARLHETLRQPTVERAADVIQSLVAR